MAIAGNSLGGSGSALLGLDLHAALSSWSVQEREEIDEQLEKVWKPTIAELPERPEGSPPVTVPHAPAAIALRRAHVEIRYDGSARVTVHRCPNSARIELLPVQRAVMRAA